jgi:hypothetical protein
MRRRDDGFAGGTLGAEVLGVDIASNLVAAGRQRAIAEGLGPTASFRKAMPPICTISKIAASISS